MSTGATASPTKSTTARPTRSIATVRITVNATNDTVLALADHYTTFADQPLMVVTPGVLGNDTNVEHGTLTAVLVSGPAHGTLALNANGSFTYTPAADFGGPDSFVYKASAGTDDSSPVTVTITVTAVNDVPVATDDSYGTNEDGVLAIAAPGVLANDVDLGGGPLSAAIVSDPEHGTLTLNADGSLSYAPNADFNGADSFTYTASDGAAASNIATVTITVNAVNDAPIANDDWAFTAENTPVTIAVLANDWDVDGDPLTVSAVDLPAHGGLAIDSDGTVTYTPAANYGGLDTFTYMISDGHGGTATTTVEVIVDDKPIAADDTVTTAEDTPVTIDVLANDTDVDGDAVGDGGRACRRTAAPRSIPTGRSPTRPRPTTTAPTRSPTISDGHGGRASAVVAVTITAVNDAPIAVDDAATTAEDTPVTITVLANDSDVDDARLAVRGGRCTASRDGRDQSGRHHHLYAGAQLPRQRRNASHRAQRGTPIRSRKWLDTASSTGPSRAFTPTQWTSAIAPCGSSIFRATFTILRSGIRHRGHSPLSNEGRTIRADRFTHTITGAGATATGRVTIAPTTIAPTKTRR